MTNLMLYSKINSLPPAMITEVDNFIDFLKSKQQSDNGVQEREFGCGKGLIVIYDDFDEPLDDFKEYM